VPARSDVGELLDGRTAVMEMEMEMAMVCYGKGQQPNIGPSIPEFGVRHGVTGKGGKVDGFPLATPNQFSLAALSQLVPVNAGPRLARARRLSAHRGHLPTTENTCTGAVLVPASALPQTYPGPHHGHSSPRGVRAVIGGVAVLVGGVSAWGLVAGVGVDISPSAVLGFLSATHPAAVKLIDALRSHCSAPALYVCDRYLYRHATDRGEKVAVHMGGNQCRL
jgi:hypothetical protein